MQIDKIVDVMEAENRMDTIQQDYHILTSLLLNLSLMKTATTVSLPRQMNILLYYLCARVPDK